MTGRNDRILFALSLLGGLLLLGTLVVRLAREAGEDDGPPERQVRLANRTIVLARGRRAFPKSFAARQTPSARKTVPYVVVSERPVSPEIRARAAACGARVLGFMPVNALAVEAGEKALARLADEPLFAAAYELEPGDKIQARVRERIAGGGTVDIVVTTLMPTDVPLVSARAKELGGTVLAVSDGRSELKVRVPSAAVEDLAGRGDVRWIASVPQARLHADVAVGPQLMNVRTVWDAHGLTGRGQVLSTSDSGLDTGDLATAMADFQGRLLGLYDVAYKDEEHPGATARTLRTDDIGHGTHTAGLLVGTGALSGGQVKGVAHGARLYVTGIVDAEGYLQVPELEDLFRPPRACYPAFIHSASWGDDAECDYGTWSRELDAYVWEHPDFLPVFSCGNQGAYGSGTVSDPAGAKNCLAVGATGTIRPAETSPNKVMGFSSRGPMPDGRIKPDVCAPGNYILSTRSTQTQGLVGWEAYLRSDLAHYVFNGGTSMACPLVAGAAALVREWLVDRLGYTNDPPSAAVLKAVLTGGARDLSGAAGASCGGGAPNGSQGWGRVDLGETLYPSDRAVKVVDRIPFAQGSELVLRVTTTAAAPLDVQLAWIDPPAQPGAGTALVNDLDLVVSNETTGAVAPVNGRSERDNVNTMEGVRLATAPAATYAIHVKGVRVPYPSTEGGAAALYVRGALAAETAEVTAVERPEEPWVALRLRTEFPELPDWGSAESFLHPLGTVVHVTVPDDLPDGAACLTGLCWKDVKTDKTRDLGDLHLLEIAVAPDAEGAGVPVRDAAGGMPKAFDVTLDGPREVRFRYYESRKLVLSFEPGRTASK